MPLFPKLLRNRTLSGATLQTPPVHVNNSPIGIPVFNSTWNSEEIVPEEVEELIHACTLAIKARAGALDTPFLLLPYRPDSDLSSTKTFIRHYFTSNGEGLGNYRGSQLLQELRFTKPEVLCSILKWCWSRLPGGVVTWNVYEMFRLGEQDSGMSRNAFNAFIPISVHSQARRNIIFDFFDLLASIAAHGKTNGLGGRQLSRLAGWWAFEHRDDGNGFEGGYDRWVLASKASSHLFFAYLRSLSPDESDGFSALPLSLQKLMTQTEYPPEARALKHRATSKVVMIVDTVSPTPFALLRRANHFEYRNGDYVLQQYSEHADPIHALTDECKRVLTCVSSTNQSGTACFGNEGHNSGGLTNGMAIRADESWSRFEDLGFSSVSVNGYDGLPMSRSTKSLSPSESLKADLRLRQSPGRPVTPSWADFLSSGFTEDPDHQAPSMTTHFLPPDKSLPPIGMGHPRSGAVEATLGPGELASISRFNLDETFWWVWMTSLGTEEPAERKAVFGRCALIETNIDGGSWLVIEEQVKGASPEPLEGAYIAEKKSRFAFSRRGKMNRQVSATNIGTPDSLKTPGRSTSTTPTKAGVTPEQQARVRTAAVALVQQKQEQHAGLVTESRASHEGTNSLNRNSAFTLASSNEAGAAMKWASDFDKRASRAQYLGNDFLGTGQDRPYLDYSIMPPSIPETMGSTFEPSQEHASPIRPVLEPALPGKPPQEQPISHLSEPVASAQNAEETAIRAPNGRLHNTSARGDLSSSFERSAQPTQAVTGSAGAVLDREHLGTPSQEKLVSLSDLLATSSSPWPASFPEGIPLPDLQSYAMPLKTNVPSADPAEEAVNAGAVHGAPKPAQDRLPDVSQFARTPAWSTGPHLATTQVGRKPVPRSNNLENHPAFRNMPIEKETPSPNPLTSRSQTVPGAQVAAKTAWYAHSSTRSRATSTLESPKLHKRNSSAGLIKLFSKNKAERNLQAARLEPPPSFRPPPEYGIGRRLSMLRRKHPDAFHSAPILPAGSPVGEETHAELSATTYQSRNDDADEPEVATSAQDSSDGRPRAGSQFGQGPLMDLPAFVPEECVHSADQERPAEQQLHTPEQPHHAQPVDEEFVEGTGGCGTTEALQEEEDEEEDETFTTPNSPNSTIDRWAQIRKHATDRRTSEGEHSRMSHSRSAMMDRTDDGETSGEETIESRVARIKARVAELTNGGDSRAPGPSSSSSPL